MSHRQGNCRLFSSRPFWEQQRPIQPYKAAVKRTIRIHCPVLQQGPFGVVAARKKSADRYHDSIRNAFRGVVIQWDRFIPRPDANGTLIPRNERLCKQITENCLWKYDNFQSSNRDLLWFDSRLCATDRRLRDAIQLRAIRFFTGNSL